MAKKRNTPDPGLPAPGSKPIVPRKLIVDLRELIESTRTELARVVNSAHVSLNWQIGHRLRVDVLGTKRAGYGERIIRTVAEGLTADYGREFSEKNLRHMIRFVERFPDREIVSALGRQLGWTHFRALIYIDDPLRREFYAKMCRVEREWARDDDGDEVREVYVNTLEGLWTGMRTFLRPFRGVNKNYIYQYITMFEWGYNVKRATLEFLWALLGVRSATT